MWAWRSRRAHTSKGGNTALSRAHASRHRIAAAATLVAAVTVGTLTAVPAAVATTGAVTAAGDTQQVTAELPPGSRIRGNGTSGFLTRLPSDGTFRWTRYEDGATTVLPTGDYQGGQQTDMIAKREGATYKLYDMATGADPVVIDTAFLGTSAEFVGLAGATVVMKVTDAGEGTSLHLVGKPAGTVVDRRVNGLPRDTVIHHAFADSPGTLNLFYTGTVGGVSAKHVARVDVATAAITEDRAVPKAYDEVLAGPGYTWRALSSVSTTATHVAWTEKSSTGTVDLVVARWGEAAVQRIPLGTKTPLTVRLLGDWVMYAVTGGAAALTPDPYYALTAQSLTSGRTVKLLDHVISSRSEPGGAALVQGGSIAQGDGLFRIAPGEDGTPAATQVASTGETVVLGAKEHATAPLPTAADLARGDEPGFFWEFSKPNRFRVVLTHTASGKRWTSDLGFTERDGSLSGVRWTGMFDDHSAASNGDYTWKMTARPSNGIGPDLVRTGTLKVTGKPAPHDFSDSGLADLLVLDGSGSGRLLNYDARQSLYETRWGYKRTPTVIGQGWNIYDRLAAPGNLDASPYADVIGRDRVGDLWLYSGTGHAFAPRTKIGGGWQTYDKLVGGSSDLTNDGRSDLLAADKAGDLWLYKGTGKGTAPFAARKKIGGGWGIYNQISAVGNLAGGPAGDLVARDRAGVLWLYLGKGDGTFAPRTRIGTGWDRYTDLVGVGDVNRDGRPDLVAQGVMGGNFETLSYYVGTGDWRAPFSSRREVYSPEPLGTYPTTLF